ncbi:MAG TPA: hypothetical protein VF121_05140 [Thermoanaerobaculia bacterium]|nr:hypothetical protein [Thermoanaerobaculia bacterium]
MTVALALAAAAAGLLPAPAAADIDPGFRAGFYSDAEAAFIGGELLTDITRRWFFNPNLEYVFVDDGSLWTLNADAHYDFDVETPLAVWAGGGLAVIFREFDDPRLRRLNEDDDTEIGLNLLAGVGAKRGAMRPYLQGKIVIADETEAVIAVGLRFN